MSVRATATPSNGRLVFVALGLATVFWVFESLAHAFILEPERTFVQQLFAPDAHELWMRVLVIAALTSFAAVLFFYNRSKALAERAGHESREQRLRAEWFSESFEQSAIGIVENTHGGMIISANPAFEKMIGYSKEELLKMRVSEISIAEDNLKNLEFRQQVIDGEINSFEMEKRYVRKDGSILWGRLSVAHTSKQWSGDKFFIGQIQDITERKRAEGELEESELRLRTVSESTRDGIIMLDSKGRISLWNDAASSIFGFTTDEAIGQSAHKILVPSDLRESSSHGMARFLSSGEGPVVGKVTELIAECKDGTLVPVELSVSPVRLEGEWHAVGIARDISSRKKAEEALFASNEKLNVAFEQAPIGMAITSLEGEFQKINHITAEFLGCPESKLLGRNWREFTHPDDVERNEQLQQNLINTDEPNFTIEKRYISGRGEPAWGLLNTSLVRGPGKEPKYFLSHVQDITERKNAEQERRRVRELSERLNHLNEMINSSLDFPSMLDKVIDSAREAIDSDLAVVMQRNRSGWTKWHHSGVAPESATPTLPADYYQHLFEDGESKTPYIANDPDSDPIIDQKLVQQIKAQAIMQVPLAPKRGKSMVLGFAHKKDASFSEIDRDFATKLGASLELAIENSRLFEDERRIADTLQESALVMPQQVEGVEFGHVYHSATEAARVGGDFYDLFPLEDGKIAAVIGDVSGKGIEAAALAAEVKTTLRAYCHSEKSPSAALALTNQMLNHRSARSQFVTVVLAIMDTNTHEVVYCNAGHPPPIYRRGRSANVLLTSGSPMIGAFSDIELGEASIMMERGDSLVLYTDGMTEARHIESREMFDSSRLVEAVIANYHLSQEQLPQALHSDVSDWTGGDLKDDVAILTLTLS